MAEKKESTIARLDSNGLKKSLGITDLFAVGYGDLGSSIYYALGITTFYALGAAPLSLFIAGLIFACTSLTYAEMTAATKASGGSASFARYAFNDLISFIAGWGLLLDFIVTIAISIFSVSPYLAFLSAGFKETSIHLGFSVGLIAILYIINFFGTKHSTRISIILTGFALITQFAIILIGLFTEADFIGVFKQMRINIGTASSPTWPEFWKGTAMAMVAYTGIESIAALGSETKSPIKTLPRAVITVMTVLVCMYLGISIVGLSAMTPQELGTTYQLDPLAGIVANMPFGHILGPWVGILAAALLLVAGNAGLIGASRLSFNMGEYYQLPRFFYRVHPKYRTPYISIAFFGVLASLIILWSRGYLHLLADLYNFGAMLAFFFAHLSLIVLRIKQPDLERPFRAPLNIKIKKGVTIPLTAIIGALATFSVWVLVVITKPEGRTFGFIWMAAGLTMYVIYRRRKKIAPTAQVQIEKVKIPEYKPIKVTNILVPTRGGAETETVQVASELAKMHNAKLTAVHIIEVPYSMPLDSPLPYRTLVGKAVLQRAEAIAREFNIELQTEIIHSRSVEESILTMLREGKYDLLVMGAVQSPKDPHKGLSRVAERILRLAPCRVFIASSYVES